MATAAKKPSGGQFSQDYRCLALHVGRDRKLKEIPNVAVYDSSNPASEQIALALGAILLGSPSIAHGGWGVSRLSGFRRRIDRRQDQFVRSLLDGNYGTARFSGNLEINSHGSAPATNTPASQ